MEDGSVWPPPFKELSSSACSQRLVGTNRTYDVGPGKTYTELNQVPWLQLTAGDVVNIFYRTAPYKTLVKLQAQGTAAKPVYINGVTDDQCNRPVLDANGATPADDAKAAGFGSDIQGAGVFTIYYLSNVVANASTTYTPQYITIQNLKLMNANPNSTYTTYAGGTASMVGGAAGIYAVRVKHLTVENCEITANANGVFTNTRGLNSEDNSSHIIIRRNYVHDNGSTKGTEHNLYIQAMRSLYEGNYLGQAQGGSTIKDRSSGTVIRFNYILASARALDLVETEEQYVKTLENDPLYNYAWVYGNFILNNYNAPLGLASRAIHWGFDNTMSRARSGTLFFYGNTYVQHSTQAQYYQASAFQVGGNDDYYPTINMLVEASGNIFWNDDGTTLWQYLASSRVGRVLLKGVNYIPPKTTMPDSVNNVQLPTFSSAGAITAWTQTTTPMVDFNAGTPIFGNTTTNSPKLDASYLPQTGSPVLDKGILGPTSMPAGVTAANLTMAGQFTLPIGMKARVMKGMAMDLGAFEQP